MHGHNKANCQELSFIPAISVFVVVLTLEKQQIFLQKNKLDLTWRNKAHNLLVDD